VTSFSRRLEHFSQLPELRPMTFVRSAVGARSLSTSLSTKTLVQSAIHRPPRAHWLSWSGGGEQGQTQHGGPVFKKAPTAQARPQNWRGEIAHARGASSFRVMCSRDTSCPGTRKRTRGTTRHQSTSSLLSISEQVALGSPIAHIGLNRRVLTWLYTRT